MILSVDAIRDMTAVYMNVAEVLGVFLFGSYGAGDQNDLSDLDIGLFFKDEAVPLPEVAYPLPCDFWAIDRSERELLTAHVDANPPSFLTTVILHDRNGASAAIIKDIISLDENTFQETWALWDSYMNGFFRSLKYLRKGNSFGHRICANESVIYYFRALFRAHNLVAPYGGKERACLWRITDKMLPDGQLMGMLERILVDADPKTQARLFLLTEEYLRKRGYGGCVDDWEGKLHLEIERI